MEKLLGLVVLAVLFCVVHVTGESWTCPPNMVKRNITVISLRPGTSKQGEWYQWDGTEAKQQARAVFGMTSQRPFPYFFTRKLQVLYHNDMGFGYTKLFYMNYGNTVALRNYTKYTPGQSTRDYTDEFRSNKFVIVFRCYGASTKCRFKLKDVRICA